MIRVEQEGYSRVVGRSLANIFALFFSIFYVEGRVGRPTFDKLLIRSYVQHV